MVEKNSRRPIDIRVVTDRVKAVFSLASLIRESSARSNILERHPITRKRP